MIKWLILKYVENFRPHILRISRFYIALQLYYTKIAVKTLKTKMWRYNKKSAFVQLETLKK